MPLTESLRATTMGLPNPFKDGGMDLFTVPESGRVLGDRARFVKLYGERQTAKRAEYGAPSRGRSLQTLDRQDVRLVHFHEHIDLDPLVYQQLHSTEKYTQDQGIEILANEMDRNAARIQNDQVVMVASTLRNGAVYFDANGDILPTSSGAEFTFSFSRSANNANQLNGIISASWALSTTDIPLQLLNLETQAAKDHGYVPTTAFYGKNVVTYIMNNDLVGQYLVRNPGYNDEYLRTKKIPDGLFGYRWIPIHTAFLEANTLDGSAGAKTDLWSDDLVVFTPGLEPAVKARWWMPMEGSYFVPRTLDIIQNVKNPFGNMETVYGMFSYAVPKVNPPGIQLVYGDTRLYALRLPNVTYAATVAF